MPMGSSKTIEDRYYKRKPRKCPKCGSVKVARILYGMPLLSESLLKDLEDGKVVTGGCVITENQPSWQCSQCGVDFYKPASPWNQVRVEDT